MVRVEKGRTIIELDDFEYYFVQDLQFDLIELMNCLNSLKEDEGLCQSTSFLSIMQLQKALVPSVDELRGLIGRAINAVSVLFNTAKQDYWFYCLP